MQDRTVTFDLLPAEIEQLTGASPVGPQQAFHRKLADQLRDGSRVTLDFCELGELVWYVSSGETNFQIRLRRAFVRSLYTLLSAPLDRPDLLR